MKAWHTYFFHDRKSGLTKIGRSKNPAARMRALSFGKELVPICVLVGDLENHYHKQYADHQRNGEWFHLNQEVIDSIASLAGNCIRIDDFGTPVLPGIKYPEPPKNPSVAAAIREARKAIGITQREAAIKIGYSLSAWNKFENNRYALPKRMTESILNALKP